MEFTKISNLEKWYLKYFNKKKYKAYKNSLSIYNQFLDYTEKINHLPLIRYQDLSGKTSFKHSGNSGDIIYSLPAIYELSKKGKSDIYLQTNQALELQHFHPLGNVMLNDKMIEMLHPLLCFQPQINSCNKYTNQNIDYDLDLFRAFPFPLDKGSISRWYFYVFAVFADLSKPWLIAPKDDQYKDYILIARSHRYRAPGINYKFLKKYPKKLFVGVPVEFEDINKELPDIEYLPVTNFLEMATIINSCKFFIGNQSFPFSLAEALKVNRVLEVCYLAPNVIVQGQGGYDFLYQAQFEKTVEDLYNTL